MPSIATPTSGILTNPARPYCPGALTDCLYRNMSVPYDVPWHSLVLIRVFCPLSTANDGRSPTVVAPYTPSG